LAAQGRDIRLAEDRIEGYRNFANKLWNAARLVLANLEGYDAARARAAPRGLPDAWIESRLAATIGLVRGHLRRYRFNDAASAIYQFIWHELCDWYLEAAKLPLYRPASPAERLRAQHTLVTVLETTLRLLHPFMPFITEELWQRLPHRGESVMVAPYPRARRGQVDVAAERRMGVLVDTITAVRNIRGEMRIAPGVTLTVTVRAAGEHLSLLREHAALVESLARARLTVDPAATRPPTTALAVVGATELYVDLAGIVDVAAERQRLEKEIGRVDEAIAFLRGKLGRPEFVERAPAEVVQRERDRLAAEEALRAKLVASLGSIGDLRG
jgi:valyl-tRNA synthetase